ncbi:MAG: hypothetical protein ACREFP_24905 [Acetobacteraceae bacterium]
MNKKPAALSASLVAVKGAATPTPDMPARGAPLEPVPKPEPPRAVATPAPERRGQGALSPLNFRVPAGFRREFRTYAARHDLKLNELLRRSFEAYCRAQGD